MQIWGRIFCENRRITSDTTDIEAGWHPAEREEEEKEKKAELMLRSRDVIQSAQGMKKGTEGRHQGRAWMRWRASVADGRLAKAEKRTKPSPQRPKPTPGVETTWQ